MADTNKIFLAQVDDKNKAAQRSFIEEYIFFVKANQGEWFHEHNGTSPGEFIVPL